MIRYTLDEINEYSNRIKIVFETDGSLDLPISCYSAQFKRNDLSITSEARLVDNYYEKKVEFLFDKEDVRKLIKENENEIEIDLTLLLTIGNDNVKVPYSNNKSQLSSLNIYNSEYLMIPDEEKIIIKKIDVQADIFEENILALDLLDIKIQEEQLKISFKANSRIQKLYSTFDFVNLMILEHVKSNVKVEVPISIEKKYDDIYIITLDSQGLFEVEDIGVWNILLKGTFDNKEFFEYKVFFNNDKDAFFTMFPKTFDSINKRIYSIRFYLTSDNYLRAVTQFYQYKSQIDKVYFKKSQLEIIGSFNYPRDINSLTMVFINQDRKVITHDSIKLNYTIKKDTVFYTVIIEIEDIIDYVEAGLYDLSFLINSKHYVSLTSNQDRIKNKDKVIKYPEKLVKLQEKLICYTVKYNEKNELQFEKTKKFTKEAKVINSQTKYIFEIATFEEIRKEDCILVFVEEGNKVKSIRPSSIKGNRIIFEISKVDFKNHYNFKAEAYIQYNSHIDLVVLKTDQVIEEKKFKTKLGRKKYISIYQENSKVVLENRLPNIFERPYYKYKNRLAKLMALIVKIFYREKIWLYGENLGEVAQDNGIAFFEYSLKNRKGKNFFITKRDNKHLEKLMLYKKNLIFYDSFKHMFYYHLAEYLIFSHGLRDVMPSILHKSMALNKKDIIYLQHGIIAMKRLFFNRNSYNKRIKKFVVSSTQEKNILIKHMNFRADQIIVTGLARFDKLNDSSKIETKKKILIMPTWREWIINDRDKFIQSDFYKNYLALLTNVELKEFAEENNVEILFYPHFEIQKKYMDLFALENSTVKVIKSGDTSLNSLIEKCSLLVTDYSSIAFDFSYLNKPVLFYHFDKKEYLQQRGAFVDLDKDLPGMTAEHLPDLINAIKFKINNNFIIEKDEKIKSNKYFEFKDKNNSKRIYKEIMKLGDRQ